MQGTDYEEYADAMEQSYRERVSKKPVQKKGSAGAIARRGRAGARACL